MHRTPPKNKWIFKFFYSDRFWFSIVQGTVSPNTGFYFKVKKVKSLLSVEPLMVYSAGPEIVKNIFKTALRKTLFNFCWFNLKAASAVKKEFPTAACTSTPHCPHTQPQFMLDFGDTKACTLLYSFGDFLWRRLITFIFKTSCNILPVHWSGWYLQCLLWVDLFIYKDCWQQVKPSYMSRQCCLAACWWPHGRWDMRPWFM